MELLELFEENFKPFATIPWLSLSKEFIINNGYTENDINYLIENKKIEKYDKNGFRFTSDFMKEFVGCGINTIPQFVRDEFNI